MRLYIQNGFTLFLFSLYLFELRSSPTFCRGPVVKVVGYEVALRTFREFLQNAYCVRSVVAAGTSRDSLMFARMAEDTSQLVMF